MSLDYAPRSGEWAVVFEPQRWAAEPAREVDGPSVFGICQDFVWAVEGGPIHER
jgi:hypothetical protein